MKLYHMNYTRSVRPRWLLEEMNLDYELIKVSVKDIQQEEYKKIHPLAKIPVLIDEGLKIFESSAICTYLADRYIEKGFAPNFDSPARAFYYQWLFYASTTLDTPVENYMFLTIPDLPENLLPFAKKNNLSKEEILNWFDLVCQPLAEILEGKKYLVEDRFTVADIIVSGILLWALELKMLEKQPILKEYVQRITNRPAFLRGNQT